MARISITPAEEDEVIIAGARSGGEPEDYSGTPEEQIRESGASDFAGCDEAVPSGSKAIFDSSTEPSSTSTAASPSTAEPTAEAPERAATRGKPKPSDEYHETTLEDLEQGHMPLAQRIVIVAAVVCIIGALVYYFVVMR